MQDKLDSLAKTALALNTLKGVIAEEVGVVEADMIQQVIESTYTRMDLLNAEMQLGEKESND